MKESLELILIEIVDLLEGGDIVEDFEDNPYAVGIIRSIYSIASMNYQQLKQLKNYYQIGQKLQMNT